MSLRKPVWEGVQRDPDNLGSLRKCLTNPEHLVWIECIWRALDRPRVFSLVVTSMRLFCLMIWFFRVSISSFKEAFSPRSLSVMMLLFSICLFKCSMIRGLGKSSTRNLFITHPVLPSSILTLAQLPSVSRTSTLVSDGRRSKEGCSESGALRRDR